MEALSYHQCTSGEFAYVGECAGLLSKDGRGEEPKEGKP